MTDRIHGANIQNLLYSYRTFIQRFKDQSLHLSTISRSGLESLVRDRPLNPYRWRISSNNSLEQQPISAILVVLEGASLLDTQMFHFLIPIKGKGISSAMLEFVDSQNRCHTAPRVLCALLCIISVVCKS